MPLTVNSNNWHSILQTVRKEETMERTNIVLLTESVKEYWHNEVGENITRKSFNYFELRQKLFLILVFNFNKKRLTKQKRCYVWGNRKFIICVHKILHRGFSMRKNNRIVESCRFLCNLLFHCRFTISRNSS